MGGVSEVFNNSRLAVLVLSAGMILTAAVSGHAESEDEKDSAPGNVELYQGRPALRLSEEQIRRGGVEVASLERTELQPEFRAVARVTDVRELAALRSRYQSANAEQKAAAAALATARETLGRLEVLYRDAGNISERQLREARVDVREASVQHSAAALQAASLLEQARLRWGHTLSDWLTAPDPGTLDALLDGREVLLLLSLRPADSMPPDVRSITVSRDGARSSGRTAQLVSPAPISDPLAPGETYFFTTAAQGLRVGMVLDVWIPAASGPRRGFVVPGGAIVWVAGRPSVFVQVRPELFVRIELGRYYKLPDAWFVEAAPDLQQPVVVKGAQLLLSEEYRWNIPDEDEVD